MKLKKGDVVIPITKKEYMMGHHQKTEQAHAEYLVRQIGLTDLRLLGNRPFLVHAVKRSENQILIDRVSPWARRNDKEWYDIECFRKASLLEEKIFKLLFVV